MDEQQLKLLKKINRRSQFTQFLAWLALFFTAVGIAAGYKNWLRIHDKAKLGLSSIEEIRQELPEFALKKRLDSLEQDFNENLKNNKVHLDKAMLELRNIQDSTQHIAETVYTQVETLTKQQASAVKIQTPTIRDWSLGEVHFLLQTAVQRFKLEQDKAGAIAAFKLADSLLVERGSIELLPVRKQISRDIATVNQYARPDMNDLSSRIDQLLLKLKPITADISGGGKKIELLTINHQTALESQSPEQLAKQKNEESDSLVDRVKKKFNDVVVIRKYDKPIQTEMDAEAKDRLYQLLSLRLETLRMMLLQGENTMYHEQISRIKTLIKNYYPATSSTYFESQLNVLKAANLSPPIPDISNSLKLLESTMTQQPSKGLE